MNTDRFHPCQSVKSVVSMKQNFASARAPTPTREGVCAPRNRRLRCSFTRRGLFFIFAALSAPKVRPHCSLGQRPTAIKLSLESLVTRARSQAPAWECSISGGSSLLPDLQKHSAPERNGRLEPPRQGRSQAGAWERDREKVRVGEGADANTRGRVCSPERAASMLFHASRTLFHYR